MRFFFAFVLSLLIVSCGSGGGSNDTTPVSPPSPPSTSETCEDYDEQIKRCRFTWDNITRTYYIKIPTQANENNSLPLLISMHGYGGNALSHINYTNFKNIADREGFYLIYPQGANLPSYLGGSTHWNVGGFTSKSTIDDLGFINQIIENVSLNYNLNQNRIYATGMSNGGYMSYALACNMSDKIAAIASVTGSMTNDTYNECATTRPVPVLQIHGLRDVIVPYIGNEGSKSISDVMEFWAQNNSCDTEPLRAVADYEDFAVYYDYYQNCLNKADVELILSSKMGHTWPWVNNEGFSASEDIWRFVSQFNLFGKI